MRNRLKSLVTEKINLYGLLPPPEQRSKMNAAEIMAHIAQVVAGWRKSDSFLHDGKDKNVSWLPSMYKFIANHQHQDNPVWFNHFIYHEIIVEFFGGPKGLATLFPHKFRPLFPIPSMSLVADVVCGFFEYIWFETYISIPDFYCV